ncbi:SprT family zinc-dependent metalloprotease [Natronorubrum daqingense]|uniref:Predicted Zn-dependent metalloprotease, SprT family n=1 Tax=Natronorubrum daqingense TaxID=588898 RepID=A0A1N6ZKC5_9EURY|nr:SprT-like domain-containing protein [Natronorubrum daqingense]APX95325.1 sprT domain-containing protein [Natronorubrum daqingense]SIR27303.1 Predicted Zn-dependent metalloprotease, SprT family [Natronorubrum daqingense]
MTDADLTIDDEIVARARIHAREVCREYDLEIDREALEWEVSTRARRRAGACRWNRSREVATIVLTRQAYERYEWETFAGVVRHELVHAWEFQRFGESGHGTRFREQATRLEAPRHCETFSEPRYVLRCLGSACEWSARRHRASKPVKAPDQYRCGQCGHDYEVEHAESGRTWTSASEYGGVKAALGETW